MRQYETAFLLSPKLSEEETASFITQMADVISQKKGKMIKEDRWGKRRMAYPIKRFEEAFYVIFLYESDPEVPYELERRFKQTESVLRFLTVKKESKENKRKKKKHMPEEAASALEGEGLGEKEEAKENLSPDETGKEEM
jgi:small subunit ribosomal protein S6